MKKQVTAQRAVSTTVNKHLLNIITPSGLDYDNVSVSVGEQFGKIYCISKYPTTDGVPYGWLADLCNLEGTSTVVEYRYTDPANIINVYNKRIKDLRADKELAKEESDRQRIEKAIDDLREMIKRITVANEPIGYVNIMLFPQDIDAKNLAARVKRVSSHMTVILLFLETNSFQKQFFFITINLIKSALGDTERIGNIVHSHRLDTVDEKLMHGTRKNLFLEILLVCGLGIILIHLYIINFYILILNFF